MYGVVDFDNCKLYDDSLNEAYLYVREQLREMVLSSTNNNAKLSTQKIKRIAESLR